MIPRDHFVGLYGSHSGDWRDLPKELLGRAGISWYDPTDSRWQGITHENGDEQQELISDLVAQQHRGMLGAACVIYHLGRRVEYRDPGNVPDPDNSGQEVSALAARCELGFLTGKGIQTFAHIEPDVEGRNYLWGQMQPYRHIVRCASLIEAAEQAIAYMDGES